MTDTNPRADQLREALNWLDHQPHAEALTAARFMRSVLEGPTDEMVGAAAKQLVWWLTEAEWEDIEDSELDDLWLQQARSILQAALAQIGEPQ